MVTRELPIEDAADALGVSRRTVERRVRRGELRATRRDGRRLVAVPVASVVAGENAASVGDSVSVGVPMPRMSCDGRDAVTDNRDRPPVADALVSELRARLADAEEQRDHWRHQAEGLSQSVSELTATIYRLGERQALPIPPTGETSETRERPPWWKFWVSWSGVEA